MTDASFGPPGFGKLGSTYPAYSDVGGPDISPVDVFTNVVLRYDESSVAPSCLERGFLLYSYVLHRRTR
jgi:hypothetical protein